MGAHPRLLLSLLVWSSSLLHLIPQARPLCTDSRVPVMLNSTLEFCPNDAGGSCCDVDADAALQGEFNAMGLKPDGRCATLLKPLLCAKCNPFSADLFDLGSTTRKVPLLCSSASAGSSRSEDPVRAKVDYCQQVWKYCKRAAISNSPFHSSAPGNARVNDSSSMIADLWPSENEFCAAFSSTPNNQTVCFNGNGVSFTRRLSSSPKGMCLEKISSRSYLNMVAHPDGSSKAFFSRQDGKIWLASIPEQGTGDSLQLDETRPFLDLTAEDPLNSPQFMDVAFHPDFANNGRFFISYICDGTQSRNCAGKCSCDQEVGCDPSKLVCDNGVRPCQYHLVVSEYSAEGSSSNFSEATHAMPPEVRRIISIGLPYSPGHSGQLLFGPSDGYLYLSTGNDGKKGDPFIFSQNKRSLLGKILRLNIDDLPELSEVASKNLWGNYTIPEGNPYSADSNSRPEIWALGLGNPGRCSFDSARPFHLYCADESQEQYKVVDFVSKGGNYEWIGAYEGLHVQYAPWVAQGTKSTHGIIFPIMGYKVPSVAENMASASIVGGSVYRGSADPCLYGRYLFADMYTTAMWIGMENAAAGSNYTSTSIPLSCSVKTPLPCKDSSSCRIGSIMSFGEDNNKDAFILSGEGVYRIVQPTLCDFARLNSTMTKSETSSSGSDRRALMLKVLEFVLAVLAGCAAGCAASFLVWSCFCNNQNICCNWIGIMRTNNSTHKATPPASPTYSECEDA